MIRRLPSRTELAGRTLLRLQRGGRLKPDVLLVEAGGGRVVVKDWERVPLGRLLARREARIHGALRGHDTVPRFLGFIDARAFALEYRPGRRFSRRHPDVFSPAFGEALAEAVGGLHRRGVAHLDLRHRGNVRADPAGRPVLLDFGAALHFRPGSRGARWLLPWLARIDRRALGKWRRLTAPIPQAADPGSRVAGAVGASDRGLSMSRPT